MNLIQKIKKIYPELTDLDFQYKVIIQNDENGIYIAKWEHPTLAQPTQEDLDGISS